MKLRKEIYEQGDGRDVAMSIEKFLGRKQSVEPFLKKIGVKGGDERKKVAMAPSKEQH
jgi:Zn-dependent oligopeptidase